MALLQHAVQDGGRLDVVEIVPAEQDALAACLERDWLQRNEDQSLEPPVWYTITEIGQAVIGDPALRPVTYLEKLLREISTLSRSYS